LIGSGEPEGSNEQKPADVKQRWWDRVLVLLLIAGLVASALWAAGLLIFLFKFIVVLFD
jgi:hypothetical protein